MTSMLVAPSSAAALPPPAAPLSERLAAVAGPAPLLPHATPRSPATWAGLWRADDLGPAQGSRDCASSGFTALDAELPGSGWPRGQLVELLLDTPGIGELSLLLPALAQSAVDGAAALWVLPHDAPSPAGAAAPSPTPSGGPGAAGGAMRHFPTGARPYAPALAAAGIDLARCIFVQPGSARESLWSLEQALRAAHVGAVIGWLPDTSSHDAAFRALRRLHLLAQQHRALVFVLRPALAAESPSPAALRLHLTPRDGRLQVQVLKRRGRPLLDPVLLDLQPSAGAMPRPASSPASVEQREPLVSQPIADTAPLAAATRAPEPSPAAAPWLTAAVARLAQRLVTPALLNMGAAGDLGGDLDARCTP